MMRIFLRLVLFVCLFSSISNGAQIIDKKPLFVENDTLVERKIDTNLISYTNDSGYLKCESNFENNLSKIKLTKFNKYGKKSWEQFIDSNISYNPKYLKSIDDFYLIIGETKNDNEIFILNGHSTNKVFWEKRFKISKLENNYGIVRSKNGFLIFNYINKNKLWMMKLDLGGTKIWELQLSGSFSKFKPIATSYLDNFYLAVSFYSAKNKQDIKIYKINDSGKIVWNQKIKKSKNIIPTSINVSQNAIYLTDSSLSKLIESNVYKLDTNGSLIWERKFLQYEIKNLIIDVDNSLIISGKKNDIKNFTNHIFVLKLDSDGIKLWEDKDRYYKLNFPLNVEKKEDNLTIFGISDYSTINILSFNETKIVEDRNKFKIIDILSENNETLIKKFLENYKFDLNEIEFDHEKLLYFGLKTNNLNVIKTLYDNKLFTKNAYNGFFYASPIFQIIKQNKINYELIEYMLNKNCDINKKDINNKYTPLAYAIASKNNKLAKFLIDNKADLNLGEEENRPLILAIITKNRKIFDYLIKNGAKSDITFSSKILNTNLNSISPNNILAYQLTKEITTKNKIKKSTLKNISKKYPKIDIDDTFIKVINENNKTNVYYIVNIPQESNTTKENQSSNTNDKNTTDMNITLYINSKNEELNSTKKETQEKYLYLF